MLFPSSLRERHTPDLLEMADVDGTLRPFELTVEEFDRLCQAYLHICKSNPSLVKYDPRSEKGLHDKLFLDPDLNADDL